jgi:predicted GNAT family N-acyltransferase
MKKSLPIKFKVEHDDNLISIIAYIDNNQVGCVEIVVEQSDSLADPYIDSEFVNIILEHEDVIDIRTVSVNDEFQKLGIGSKLMKKAIKFIEDQYSELPIFINASPMGDISLSHLIKFYKKYGFEILHEYTEYNNAPLWKEAA